MATMHRAMYTMNSSKISLVVGLLLAIVYVEGAPPAKGEWTMDTVTCLFRMSFGARFSIPYEETDGVMKIKEQDLPTGALSSDSTCTDNTVVFNLRYFLSAVMDPSTYHWAYILEFSKGTNDDYMLKKVTVKYYVDSHFANAKEAGNVFTESTQDVQPKAKLGTYLASDEVRFNVGLSKIGVLMTDIRLQPFERSVQGGGYGTETAFEYNTNASNLASSPGLFLLTSLIMFAVMIFQR